MFYHCQWEPRRTHHAAKISYYGCDTLITKELIYTELKVENKYA